MANSEHLNILKQGVKVWNEWREENPEVEQKLIEEEARAFHGIRIIYHTKILGGALRNEVDIQRQRIDRMVRDNDDHGVMVRQLEALHDAAVQDEADAAETTAEMRMKSGDEIAEEIQEFLRNQD